MPYAILCDGICCGHVTVEGMTTFPDEMMWLMVAVAAVM
jgi:hypothetical protein